MSSGREAVLRLASKAVLSDRQNTYGRPEDNFKRIAAGWSAYKGVPFTRADVAMMMVIVKVMRAASSPLHDDNYVDIAGYAACAADAACADSEEESKDGPAVGVDGACETEGGRYEG